MELKLHGNNDHLIENTKKTQKLMIPLQYYHPYLWHAQVHNYHHRPHCNPLPLYHHHYLWHPLVLLRLVGLTFLFGGLVGHIFEF